MASTSYATSMVEGAAPGGVGEQEEENQRGGTKEEGKQEEEISEGVKAGGREQLEDKDEKQKGEKEETTQHRTRESPLTDSSSEKEFSVSKGCSQVLRWSKVRVAEAG